MRTTRGGIALLLAIMLLSGCGRPAAVDRDNRRVLEEILTAITLSNQRLLAESFARAEARFHDGHLTEEEFQGLAAIVKKAQNGEWPAAEADAYGFRKAHPFVKR